MAMWPCSRCLSNNWAFEHPDSATVRATCNHCGYDVEFAARYKQPKLTTKPVALREPGQPCRHCQTPVIRKEHRKGGPKRKGAFYFNYWLACPKCKAIYMIPSAKRFYEEAANTPAAPRFATGEVEAQSGAPPW